MMACSTMLARWPLQAVEPCRTLLYVGVPKLASSASLCKHARSGRVMACCACHQSRTNVAGEQQDMDHV